MENSRIDRMVTAFLSWKLPQDFSPDAGISFMPTKPNGYNELGWWPVGTNLLTADQARQMVTHMIDALPANDVDLVADAGRMLVTVCHEASRQAGWWRDIDTDERIIHRPHVVGEKLMLVVSEISEAMEGHRKNLMDDKLPHRSMVEVELADAVIRIADLAGALGLDLGGAIAEKLEFNASRPDHKIENRKGEHGKKY